MSFFNQEQQEHMNYLSSIPPEKRCWCGWYELGKCLNCPSGVTSADKMARRCPICTMVPSRPEDENPHTKKCPNGTNNK